MCYEYPQIELDSMLEYPYKDIAVSIDILKNIHTSVESLTPIPMLGLAIQVR